MASDLRILHCNEMIVAHQLLDCNEMFVTQKLLVCYVTIIVTHKLLDCNDNIDPFLFWTSNTVLTHQNLKTGILSLGQ